MTIGIVTDTETSLGETMRPRRERSEASALPEMLLAKFGGPRARPRVVQAYDPKSGWSTARKGGAVTMELLVELRAAGITLVEAKWRSHRRQINLSTLDLWRQG
jgi:hypothetical protein